LTLLVAPAGSLTGSLNRRRASQAGGFAAVAIAAAALIGWWGGPPLLSNWGEGLPNIMPAGALCLAALGLALIFRARCFAVAAGVAVASLAAYVLALYLLDIDAPAEWLVLRSAIPPPGPEAPTFRVAHAGALAFLLAGISVAFSRFERYRLVATGLAGLAAAVVVFALLGYLTGIDALYPSGAVVSPPLPTAAGLLFVALGIILRIRALPLRRPRPLWHFLAVLAGAVLVPLLLFGAYAQVSIADAKLDEVRKELMNGARALSAAIDREILGEIERLQALAASPSVRQGDFAAFQRQAETSLGLRQSGSIVLVDRDMRQLVNTATPHRPFTEEAVIAEPAKRAFATGRPQFTDLFSVTSNWHKMFGIILPVEIDGENRYALVRTLSQHTLTQPIAADNLPPGWQAVISGVSNRILAQSTPPLFDEGEEAGAPLPHAQRPHASRRGVLEFVDRQGQPSLEAYALSDLTGWATAVWEPKWQFEAPARALWRTLVWLALLSCGLVVLLASRLSQFITHSVGHVARATVDRGEPPPGLTPIAEVNALMEELREASARRQAAEDRLRDSERQLRLVTENVPVAIVRCDPEGRFTYANRQFLDRYHVAHSDVVGRRFPEVVGAKVFAAIERYLAECLAGRVVEFSFETTDEAGERKFLQGRYAPEYKDGSVVGMVGATNDVTLLKRAEQRLRANEQSFRQLVENSPFGIYVVDADFHLVQVSMGARKTFERVEPVIGRDLSEVLQTMWPEPFANDVIGRFHQTLATGEPHHAPSVTERRKDTGEVECFDWKIERVLMPDGRFGVVCHFYDLSERQKFEAVLRESEATFRAMFDSSAVGKIEIELDTGRFLRANAAMCKFVGYSEAELLDMSVFDLTHPDEREQDREALHNMNGGALPVFDREKRYIRKDGTTVWARVTANNIRDSEGRPLRNTAVVQDISARKQAEQALEAGRARMQLALDAARLGWFQYDPARRSGWGDARFNQILDFGDEEIPLDELMKRIHPDDAEMVMNNLTATLNPVDPMPAFVQYRVVRRDGEVRWVEIHGLAYFEGAGPDRRAVSLIGTAQDITERKQHEEQLHLLMREVNHRAKNMLSVVDAIAHQTATRNPEDFITRFSERIQALSANQDLLVRNEWKGVVISDLVRAQLAHFADLIGSRINVHGARMRFQAASAQAIGLALHELSTNAGKYGALSTDNGDVSVYWFAEGDDFHMNWIERNGPPVSAPARRGFGTTVMEDMVKRTVGGKVDLDYAPSGVSWSLTCPAANALEPTARERTGMTNRA
jgi:PAS domain S-box-containing protein